MVIQKNDTLYQEVDSKGMFNNGDSSENDTTITYLLEKNNILNEEVRGLKRENEIQLVRLCEVTEHKKKAEEDKDMVEKDKRQMNTRLDERTYDV